MTTISTNVAHEINRHHEQACAKADEAIGHAIAAGKLLLEAKSSMRHGEFLPWVRSHLSVSVRQAQNYMAAAQGKPTPIRSTPNAKQVSHLQDEDAERGNLASEPAPMPDDLRQWFDDPKFCPAPSHWHCATDDAGAYWIVPSAEHPSCFHISRLTSEDRERDSFFDGTRQPVPAFMVETYLATVFGLADPLALEWSSVQRPGLPRPFGEPEVESALRG